MCKNECYDASREINCPGLPKKENLSLPFLAYGFFKPHQLAYSQIKKFVYCEAENIKIPYKLLNINGMPVLQNEYNPHGIDAYIIDFKTTKQKNAYNTIGYRKNMQIYSWNVINVENRDVNVLMYSGYCPLPKYPFSLINDSYDWRDDPIFRDIFKYLDSNIKKLKYSPYEHCLNDLKPLITIQSIYMSLWSVLDRFLTIRYGNSRMLNVKLLSCEPYFKRSLAKNYNAIGELGFHQLEYPHLHDEIFSAEDLTNYQLNPDKPLSSALYYYTLRNNIVHSSQAKHDEIDTVWNALLGLTEIFRDVVDALSKE